MIGETEFDRLLTTWLEADGPQDVPTHVVDGALEAARRQGQLGGIAVKAVMLTIARARCEHLVAQRHDLHSAGADGMSFKVRRDAQVDLGEVQVE